MVQQPTKGFGRRKVALSDNGPSTKLRNPNDNRQVDRSASFKNAQIILQGDAAIDCIARNICDDGCMIAVTGAENLPDELKINLGPGSPTRVARVTWRETGHAGLQFIAAS